MLGIMAKTILIAHLLRTGSHKVRIEIIDQTKGKEGGKKEGEKGGATGGGKEG